jgi:hypothetical protein
MWKEVETDHNILIFLEELRQRTENISIKYISNAKILIWDHEIGRNVIHTKERSV